jgi:hypothetical protein
LADVALLNELDHVDLEKARAEPVTWPQAHRGVSAGDAS